MNFVRACELMVNKINSAVVHFLLNTYPFFLYLKTIWLKFLLKKRHNILPRIKILKI